jgi:hypothetical protein
LLLIEKANVIKYAIWLLTLLLAQGARWVVVSLAASKKATASRQRTQPRVE